jgi:hypothetical protein
MCSTITTRLKIKGMLSSVFMICVDLQTKIAYRTVFLKDQSGEGLLNFGKRSIIADENRAK